MSDNEAKFINLKEAAAIFGYTPDYIGQLIRAGKITGKQVYLNTAWVTTEEAIKNYLQKRNGTKDNILFKRKMAEVVGKFNNGIFSEYKLLMRIFRLILWFIIFLSIIFFFVLFYIFSVNFEKNVNQKVIEKSKLNYEMSK